MLALKAKTLSYTLVFYIVIALAFAASSDAKEYPPTRRAHGGLNRMMKKRSPQPQVGIISGIVGAAPNPATESGITDPPSPTSAAATTSSSLLTSSSSTSAATSSSTDTTSAAGTTTTSGSASTSVSTSGAVGSTSSSSTPSTSTQDSPDTSAPVAASPHATTQSVPADPDAPSLATSTSFLALPSSTTSSTPEVAASSSGHTTDTVLIVIASCVAAAAIIWTVIRKWIFRPSSEFEGRMQPIDWQPNSGPVDGLPGRGRRNSAASSFHSGTGHDNMASLGADAYGAAPVDHSLAPSMVPLPEHDFTPGPSHLAVVGGYADLSRGSSPQPQMHEALSRGPSIMRPNYGVPLHHQASYGAQDYAYPSGMDY